MKRILTLLTVLLSFIGLAKAQTPGENIDVTHYEVHLGNFNFTDHTLQGEAMVTLLATASTDIIVLELKSLTVNSVLCDETGIQSFSQEADFLTIYLPQALSVGQEITLDILYGGNTFNESWGGVHWWGNGYVYNLGVGFDSQPHNLGKTWFPCVDNFIDKASYDLFITVDNDKKAICGGNRISTTNNGNGTSTWHWEIPQEVATYHVSFTIGDYVEWTDTYNGIERDIPVEVYVKPTQVANVPGTFVHVKDIAAFYETHFGPYPFNRIGYICTGQGCMEHIDNIAVTSGIITGNTSQEEYVAHELSHMYFGNKVTCSTASDMWLNEGFAQFCGMFYRAGVYGESDFQNAMRSTINNITNWCRSENNWIPLNQIPLDMTYDASAVYNRGAVIVNTMMYYMGRDNFLTGLCHYLDTYAFGAASSEQLRDALTEATGIDMSGFFDTYVFTAGMPHYDVGITAVTPNDSQYETTIQLSYSHIGPSHVGQNNRVEVTFIGNEGQTHTELVSWDGLLGEATVVLDFAPVAAFADYDNHFLDAKTEVNATATAPMNISVERLKAIVNSVTDSVMLRIEGHYAMPDDDPSIPWLTLSTSHYWNVLRLDLGTADVSGQFMYRLGSDGDIIQTEHDSAVLLYRANVLDPWHTIPYTATGNWNKGKFTVDDLLTGQYTIGVIDKTIYGVHEDTQLTIQVYPNPTEDMIYVEMLHATAQQEYRITNLMGQTLLTGTVETSHGTSQQTINVSSLPTGTYFLIINGIAKKIIIQ